MARVTQKSEMVFRNAKAHAKVYLIADGNGLCLRVTPNSSKLWVFRYSHPITRKPNMLSLGKYPDISVTHAREEAKAARIDVHAGRDPKETRRARFDPAHTAPDSDFASRARGWLDSKESSWSAESHRKAKYVLEKYLIPQLKGFGAIQMIEAARAKTPAVARNIWLVDSITAWT